MISGSLNSKHIKLKEILRKTESLLVAYSGGADSSLLLKVARDVLGDKVLAVIATSETYPREESKDAVTFTKKLGVRLRLIKTAEFEDERFLSNPPERCYHCKKELFSKLVDIAKKEKLKYVADGSNVSDLSDFRPGAKASKELGVISPLREAGFTKEDIRELSRQFKLPTSDKPALACLASRVPYGTRITKEILHRIDEGEKFIRKLGIRQVRVRHHGGLARIEVEKENIAGLIEGGLADKIEKKLKDLGYHYVSIDLKGYRTGSMNEALAPKENPA